MADAHLNANVEVILVPGENPVPMEPHEQKQLQDLVRDHLLIPTDVPYHRAQVEVERGGDGRPVAVIATLLRAKTYTADVVRLRGSHGHSRDPPELESDPGSC